MASRRSNSSRTTRTPARTSSPASTMASDKTPAPASAPAPAHGNANSAAQTRTSPLTPAQAAGPALAQPPAKSPVKTPAKAAPRRTRKVKANSSAQGVAVPEELRRAMIAEAAYFHAEQRGFAPGGEVEDWLAAEAEVDVLLKASSGVPQ